MSQIAVAQFAHAAVTDPALRARCQAAGDLANLVEVAAQAGFPVTDSEMSALLDAVNSQGHELSDEALEVVSGGVTINNSHYVDPDAANINQNYSVAPHAVTINNSHREVFGGLSWP